MSISKRWPMAALALLALCVSPAAAQHGHIEHVASFHVGEEHIDLDVYRAPDASKLALISIENPLRMRGLPTGSIGIFPARWPAVVELWTKARAGVTGAEPWTPVGDVPGGDALVGDRLSLSAGPSVRFAIQSTSQPGGIAFELAPADLDAMGEALAREQKLLDSKR